MSGFEDCELHRLVYEGDEEGLRRVLSLRGSSSSSDGGGEAASASKKKKLGVNARDVHGNTPLLIACMLGRQKCVLHLLAAGANPEIKTRDKWSPIAEAISYGNRAIIAMLVRSSMKRADQLVEERSARMLKAFDELRDFTLEIHWDVHSWVPLVSRVLPSDTMRLWKRGKRIRMDSTLLDVSEQTIKRGDMSFIFDVGVKDAGLVITAIDRVKREYTRNVVVKGKKDRELAKKKAAEQSMEELAEDINWMLACDTVDVDIPSREIEFTRALSGWYGFRQDRSEDVGDYTCAVYNISGANLVTRTRTEHLTKEDRKWFKDFKKRARAGETSPEEEKAPIRNIPPPEVDLPPWKDYAAGLGVIRREGAEDQQSSSSASAASDTTPAAAVNTSTSAAAAAVISAPDSGYLGRQRAVTKKMRSFKATAWMSPDFPLPLEDIVSLLSILAPTGKHLARLRDFMERQFPEGFPVKLDIPVFPTVSARVTFKGCSLDPVSEDMFTVPKGFEEVVKPLDRDGDEPAVEGSAGSGSSSTERSRALSRGANA